jgi:hypothetical protein
MRLPRMTTRRWMIAVATVGLAMGLLAAFRQRAEGFARLSEAHLRAAADLHPPRKHGRIPRADWHALLGEKYRQAARYPWLPVEPDPPEPK